MADPAWHAAGMGHKYLNPALELAYFVLWHNTSKMEVSSGLHRQMCKASSYIQSKIKNKNKYIIIYMIYMDLFTIT